MTVVCDYGPVSQGRINARYAVELYGTNSPFSMECKSRLLERCRDRDDLQIQASGGRFVIGRNSQPWKAEREWLGESGSTGPDPATMAVVFDSRICTKHGAHYGGISCAEKLTRGITVVDQLHETNGHTNIDVCWEIDVELWKETLFQTLP